MMTLDEIAVKFGTDKSSQGHNYVPLYETLFAELRDKPVRLLELGVEKGGSLRMWKEYFLNGRIFGIDVAPDCQKHAEDRISVFIGSQDSEESVRAASDASGGEFDIVIDDGSHQSQHQIASFKLLFPLLKKGGWYVVEDLHTSYLRKFIRNCDMVMTDFLKSLVDDVNMRGKFKRHANRKADQMGRIKRRNAVTSLEETVESVLFWPGICFIKKLL